MPKLTLTVDDKVVARAKRYAKHHGVSVSQIVEVYLSAISSPSPTPTKDTPILRSLRGSLKKANLAAYRKHLLAKYR